mmetsp:Transcript_1727/g.3277  ORF Transcript_1727/g.3277 Transcript_1727/m.3277 type:complete len:365 (+) Transcript_1727:421-1515(+)
MHVLVWVRGVDVRERALPPALRLPDPLNGLVHRVPQRGDCLRGAFRRLQRPPPEHLRHRRRGDVVAAAVLQLPLRRGLQCLRGVRAISGPGAVQRRARRGRPVHGARMRLRAPAELRPREPRELRLLVRRDVQHLPPRPVPMTHRRVRHKNPLHRFVAGVRLRTFGAAMARDLRGDLPPPLRGQAPALRCRAALRPARGSVVGHGRVKHRQLHRMAQVLRVLPGLVRVLHPQLVPQVPPRCPVLPWPHRRREGRERGRSRRREDGPEARGLVMGEQERGRPAAQQVALQHRGPHPVTQHKDHVPVPVDPPPDAARSVEVARELAAVGLRPEMPDRARVGAGVRQPGSEIGEGHHRRQGVVCRRC